MVKRNKDMEREPTQDEKGKALRSVYMDRWTRSHNESQTAVMEESAAHPHCWRGTRTAKGLTVNFL